MAVRLVRKRDGKVMATRAAMDWEGWYVEYTQPRLRTVQGVSYPQKISVMEHVTKIRWRFDSKHATMHLTLMDELLYECHNLAHFLFTDLEGKEYTVQNINIPQPKRDNRIPHYSVYTVELELLRLEYVV